MSLSLVIAIILLIVVLVGIFSYRYNRDYATVGSIVASIAALLLFLMAVGLLKL